MATGPPEHSAHTLQDTDARVGDGVGLLPDAICRCDIARHRNGSRYVAADADGVALIGSFALADAGIQSQDASGVCAYSTPEPPKPMGQRGTVMAETVGKSGDTQPERSAPKPTWLRRNDTSAVSLTMCRRAKGGCRGERKDLGRPFLRHPEGHLLRRKEILKELPKWLGARKRQTLRPPSRNIAKKRKAI